MVTEASVEEVRAFWDAHPCGTEFVDAPFGTEAFFRAHAEFRYRTEWHLDDLVPFDAYRDRDVLEIGCGLGADGARFAQGGARYTGVDLTPAAVGATRQRFEILGLPGRFLVQDAENLSAFEAASFDLVYSHGVLHHTPDTRAALAEVARVLRPGGQAVLMLYHRHSFNYYVRIMGYWRARVLLYALARSAGRPAGVLEPHYRRLRREGLRYLTPASFVHHLTDGPDCPVAYAFSKAEVRRMLEPWFERPTFRVAHFPLTKALGSFPRIIEGALARTMGWYLFVYARRGASRTG